MRAKHHQFRERKTLVLGNLGLKIKKRWSKHIIQGPLLYTKESRLEP